MTPWYPKQGLSPRDKARELLETYSPPQALDVAARNLVSRNPKTREYWQSVAEYVLGETATHAAG